MTAATCDIDADVLASWLEWRVPGFAGPAMVSKFPGGQSNPTYRVAAPSGDLVLRRKPFGPLLPSAHAVEREYRLIAALHPSGFPVPRPLALCEDTGVIGAPFYAMELVDGRIFWDGLLPELAPERRHAVYAEAVRTLGRLHALEPASLGLADFGRPGNYFARQVDRWTRQYRAAQTADIPAVERLMAWLPATVPAQERSCLIHGDFRLDNIVYAPDAGSVRAVLDWELSTLGDPLADFAYLAMNWVLPADGRSGLAGIDLAAAGIPGLDELSALYCEAARRPSMPELHWHFAFNLFRLVGILQGVRQRIALGNASSAAAEASAARVEPLALAAWDQARLAGAPA